MYQGLQMDIFIRELKVLLNSLVVKRNKLADNYETLEIEKSAEMYLMVKDGMDDFTSYVNFDYDVYKAAGISPAEISDYQKDKNNIPYGIRASLIKLEREYILSRYVEKNNYYRMLAGLPDMEDTDLIYVPENDYDISTNIPIHQLDTTNMSRLMASGLLTGIIAKYPAKKYLNYLGDYSISYYRSRKALNYELLRCNTTDPDNITFDFKKSYSNAREYYMNGMYNPNLANTYKYYDNFVGLCIVIMAVQRLFGNVFKQGITREFYDTQLIRYLFGSYNIPYITDMTLAQMKILAKNLNIFLSIKSSTKVLFDLCSIFGFSNINIYKYLLVRDHVMDAVTGKPIFPTKTTANGDGTFATVPDYALMYDIYFQKVNVKSKDINAALEDKSNKVPYASMVTGDIYWVDDDNLRDKIYKATINHIESKYISMDVMFRITAMMYEICHTFRMILDNHKEFAKVSISVPKVSTKHQDLFSLIIFLCATFCKKYGFNGEIPLKPASIAYVYGFNFNADIPKILSDVLSNEYIDDSVTQYLLNFSVSSSKDVDRIYKNIKALKDFVVDQMAKTKDIEVYRAYKALYKSVLVVQDKETIYKKTDGTYASTYKDFLADLNPELSTVLDNLNVSDTKHIDDIMEHILYKMEDLCTEYKYLHTAVESNALFTVLIKLVRLFKSYTVDLKSAGVQYLFDDRYFNMLKILDRMQSVSIKTDCAEHLHLLYSDLIGTVEVVAPEFDMIDLYMKYDCLVKFFIDEYIKIKDMIWLESINWTGFKSDMMKEYSDYIETLTQMTVEDKLKLRDKFYTFITSYIREYIKVRDDLHADEVLADVESKLISEYVDNFNAISDITKEDKITIKNSISSFIKRYFVDYLKVRDDMTMEKALFDFRNMLISEYADNVDVESNITQIEKMKLDVKFHNMYLQQFCYAYIKMKDDISLENIDWSGFKTDLLSEYTDEVSTESIITYKDKISLVDKICDIMKHYYMEYIHTADSVKVDNVTFHVKSGLVAECCDAFNAVEYITRDERIELADKLVNVIRKRINDRLKMKDESVNEITFNVRARFISEYSNSLSSKSDISKEEKISMVNELITTIKRHFGDNLRVKDQMDVEKVKMQFRSDMLIEYADELGIYTNLSHDDKLKLIDKLIEGGIDIIDKTVVKFKSSSTESVTNSGVSTKLTTLDACQKGKTTLYDTDNIKPKDVVKDGTIVNDFNRKLTMNLMQTIIADIVKKDSMKALDDVSCSSDYPVGNSNIVITDKLKMTVTV